MLLSGIKKNGSRFNKTKWGKSNNVKCEIKTSKHMADLHKTHTCMVHTPYSCFRAFTDVLFVMISYTVYD